MGNKLTATGNSKMWVNGPLTQSLCDSQRNDGSPAVGGPFWLKMQLWWWQLKHTHSCSWVVSLEQPSPHGIWLVSLLQLHCMLWSSPVLIQNSLVPHKLSPLFRLALSLSNSPASSQAFSFKCSCPSVIAHGLCSLTSAWLCKVLLSAYNFQKSLNCM